MGSPLDIEKVKAALAKTGFVEIKNKLNYIHSYAMAVPAKAVPVQEDGKNWVLTLVIQECPVSPGVMTEAELTIMGRIRGRRHTFVIDVEFVEDITDTRRLNDMAAHICIVWNKLVRLAAVPDWVVEVDDGADIPPKEKRH